MELETLFNDICAAIHEKDGKTDGISALDFPSRIRAISVGPNVITSGVYGVCWDYSSSDPKLTRLTPNTDPNHFVTACPDSEPVAAIGDGPGSSPFDTVAPWAEMQKVTVLGNVFVYVPDFYYNCIDDSENSKRYWYVSKYFVDGLLKHPGGGRHIGRYEVGIQNHGSVSNNTLALSTSLSTYRDWAQQIHSDCYPCDAPTYWAVVLLSLVEYATWNLGVAIGRGYVSAGTRISTGHTDIMTYHTGSTEEGISAMQYRYVENIYGNCWKILDGILASYRRVYICSEPAKYSTSITEDYLDTGLDVPATSNRIIQALHYDSERPWTFIPKNANGTNADQYTTDGYWYSASGLIGYTVGDIYHNYFSGIAATAVYFDPMTGSSQVGCRFMMI